MDNTIRVQFYFMDDGLFWKGYISTMNRTEIEATQCLDYKGPKVIAIAADDWYGEKLPESLRK